MLDISHMKYVFFFKKNVSNLTNIDIEQIPIEQMDLETADMFTVRSKKT